MTPVSRRTLVVAVLVFVFFVSACGSSKSATTSEVGKSLKAPKFAADSSLARMQKAGKLIVGVSFNTPGFGFRNPESGVINGLDPEIAKLMAQRIFGGTADEAAKKIEYVETIPQNREAFITQGRIDLDIADFVIDAKNSVVDFAGPYYVSHGDLLVKGTNSDMTLAPFSGKAVCAVTGSTYVSSLKDKAPGIDVRTQATYPQCIDSLTKDQVVAVAGDDAVLSSNAQSSAGAFKLAGVKFSSESYGIAVKKGDRATVEFFDLQLGKVIKNGDWQRAYDNSVKTIGLGSATVPLVPAFAKT